MRRALATLATAATIAACGSSAAQANSMHRVYDLRYIPTTMWCDRGLDGADGLVYGDGPAFPVVCEKFGTPYRKLPQRYAWDQESW